MSPALEPERMVNANTSFAARRSRLLIVDDDASSRDALVKLLDTYDRKVAATGEQALALVAQDPPDLILLDVMMPGIDGFEVCRRLKDNDATRFIPIVIMTGLDDVEDRIRGIEAGGLHSSRGAASVGPPARPPGSG